MNENNIQKWMKELPKIVSENSILPLSKILDKKDTTEKTRITKLSDETIALSKKISYILRHNPEEYNVKLDEYGYCPIEDIISGINTKDNINISLQDIINAVNTSDKQRFEIKSDKIRALYGHSKQLVILKEKGTPPDILYHGTTEEAYKYIQAQGILPMSRLFVHLSTDISTAKTVAKRKTAKPVILKIDAKTASKDNIEFFIGNSTTWLTKRIDPKYITRLDI